MTTYKSIKKNLSLGILLIFSFLLVYFYYTLFRHLLLPPTPLSSKELVTPEDLTVIPSSNPFTQATLSSFDLGTASFIDSLGTEVSFPIQGTIGLPTPSDQPAPIIFIFPGYKDGLDSQRVDIGFTYLVQELANAGYLSICLNIPPNYLIGQDTLDINTRILHLFNTHFKYLKLALSGEDVGYNINLDKAGDLSNVLFMSHSLNAESIYYLSSIYSRSNQLNLSGLLFITPSYIPNTIPSFLDIPTSIIISQLDGCILSLDGQSLYNDLSLSPNRTSFTNLVYLYGANHTYFNSTAELDDSNNLSLDFDALSYLTGHDQRDFLAKYAVDLSKSLFDSPVSTLALEPHLAAPSQLYGYDVLTSLSIPNYLPIFSPTGSYSETLNTLGGEIQLKNASLSYVIDSYLPTKDTAGAFSLPGNPLDFPLLRVSWNVPSGIVSTLIPAKYRDISSYDSLSLTLGVDPTNTLNQPNQPQSFVIELKDTFGKAQRVLIDSSTPTMQYPAGDLVTNNFTSYWSTFTPLGSLRIPLSLFNHIDLSNIYSISLVFNQTNSGSLMISNMYLLNSSY